MASYGYTFSAGDTVTPARLNAARTVSDIQTADIGDSQITTAKLATVTAQSLLPAGAVMPFARATAPAGWLIANGDVVPNGSGTVQGVTADFSALHAALSTSFGTAGTLPDLRGIFVRGSGSQTIGGITYNKTFANKEGDAFQGHRHNITPSGYGGAYSSGTVIGNYDVTSLAGTGQTTNPITDGTNGTPRTASETRPANIALLYCIKH